MGSGTKWLELSEFLWLEVSNARRSKYYVCSVNYFAVKAARKTVFNPLIPKCCTNIRKITLDIKKSTVYANIFNGK